MTFFPEAVSLRAAGEGNFWHFQNNALRKLSVVDELGLADDVPLLVGKAVWESRAFAEARTLPAFRTRNWVLHDRPIRTDRLVIALEGSYRRTNMVVAHESLEQRAPSPPSDSPRPSPPAPDLFVVADQPESERHLENERDVVRHLASHGVAAFHAESLSLDDRIRPVRAARCFVVPGGAGVASLVHRIGMPTGVVEIVPPDKELVEPYAAWFCREFGFSYRAVVGSAASSSGNFTVDVAAVVRALDEVRSLTSGSRPGSGGGGQITPAIAMSEQ
jgi:capsular polysaccharide biosynthesis protein